MNKQTKEPLLRTVKRAEMGNRQILILRLLAILLSLVAGGIFILCIGYNPFVIYGTIITGAFRSAMAVQATVKIMIPLLICSLGVTLAFKMRFWNIGAEGQLIFGATCASFFALYCSNWNHVVLLLVMAVAGIVGGGLWGLIPAFFKVKFNTNETLITLPCILYPICRMVHGEILRQTVSPRSRDLMPMRRWIRWQASSVAGSWH